MNQFIETIVKMYKLNNLTPVKQKFLIKDSEDNIACCGLTAFAFSRPQFKQEVIKIINREIGGYLNDQVCGLLMSIFKNRIVRQSFMQGFDADSIFTIGYTQSQKKAYRTWYEIGKRCRERIKEEFGVNFCIF